MPCLSHVIEDQLPLSYRLDRYVSESLNLLSRSQVKARCLKAKVNGKDVKLSRLVKQGDLLELGWEDEPPQNLVPQDIPLDIVYEDEKCVIVNKAQGMVVHPGAGNRQGTLANALYFRRLSRAGETCSSAGLRTGIVHRLDKETSGIMIAAYNDEVHAFLAQQFKTRRVKKTYIAIVNGIPKEKEGKIESYIKRNPSDRKRFAVSASGKNALTFYKVIKSLGNYSLVLLRPKTGRTHQLRVHLKHIGHPILGDSLYGRSDKNFPNVTLMLHSKSLGIILHGETEERIFSSSVPKRFAEVFGEPDPNEEV